jgi:hypothetical protein
MSTTMGTETQSLDDPDGIVADFFGDAVAISPNSKILVVGADRNKEGLGKAYIYLRGPSGFRSAPAATLSDPAASSMSCFACSVAASGDTVAVGSPYEFGNGGGDVYLYVRGTSGWPATPTVKLVDPGTGSGDSFGYSVAMSGNLLVIGAPGTDSNAGTEYIYVRTAGGSWPATPTVISPNPAPTVSSDYGQSVSASGTSVAVGATGAAAIEHVGPGGFPTNITRILFDPAGVSSGASDFYGERVAISGNNVVVGTDVSTAYIYVKGTSGWPTKPTVTLPDPPGGFPQDNFGIGIAAAPGVIVVTSNDSGASGGGQAYIYGQLDGSWLSEPVATIDDPAGSYNDQFGQSVAVAGTTVVVGAPGTSSDSAVPATGVADLFSTVS